MPTYVLLFLHLCFYSYIYAPILTFMLLFLHLCSYSYVYAPVLTFMLPFLHSCPHSWDRDNCNVRQHFIFDFSVGDAIGAFAAQMLKGSVPPGVYFPEEVPGRTFREEILADISVDAITYSINIDSKENSVGNEIFTFKL